MDILGGIMKKIIAVALMSALFAAAVYATPVKLKDITSLSGVRTNSIIGYGIVVGLAGSGDKGKAYETVQSVVNMLQKLNVRVPMDQIETSNCAAVIVTSTLPPTFEAGEKLDVNIASVGNAKSLYGGVLLMTPLKAGNNDVYAVAQGPISVGGHSFEINNNSVSKNNPTVGFITGGGVTEKKLESDFISTDDISIYTGRNDFTLADTIIKGIDSKFGANTAATTDGKSIKIKIPASYKDKKSEFMAELNGIEVEDQGEPTVVLDERTGTVIMGADVRIDEVAISHGNLNVAIASKNVISQPNPFTAGTTVDTIDSNMTVEQEKAKFATIKKGATLSDVVKSLNAMGVSADDIISIVTDMKVAGAIKGKVIVK
jgi:flagellar P-ring protein precursor FlgI